jgi:hypothetical protein
MKNIIIVKVGFYKKIGINKILNTIITSTVSNQMRWCKQWFIILKAKVQTLVKTFM